MEAALQWIGPFLVAFLVVSGLLQLLWAHALSVIARKTGQGSLMEVLAWIPLAQIAPMLAVGGSSLPHFLLGTLGLVLANVALFAAAAFLGDGLGGMLGGLGALATVLLCFAYFIRLFWNTATARDLPGWVGLMMLVPLLNVFAYPIIAFHDGWAAPHKVGAMLGTLIMVGTTLPYYQIVRQIESGEGFASLLAAMSQEGDANDFSAFEAMLAEQANREGATDEQRQALDELRGLAAMADANARSAAAPTPDAPEAGQTDAASQAASIRAFLALKSRFDTLDGLAQPDNLLIPAHRDRALNLIRSIRADLEAQREQLDPESYTTLAGHLVHVEARIVGRSASTLSAHSSERVRNSAGGHGAASPPAALGAADDAAPIRPFPVSAGEDCPPGTELRSRSGDKGEEEWCQQLAEYGGLRHGWYARYFEGGRPEQVGEYRDGLRVGVWTRFHPGGEVRAQAEFERGLQHGWLLTFDREGQRQKAVRFQEGSALR